MDGLSVLIASSGRPTLQRTLDSLLPQLAPNDEVLIDVNDDAPWGHRARNRMMPRASRRTLIFIDDDDTYMPFALKVIRAAVAQHPRRMHLFRMTYENGGIVWSEPRLECGQVSTQTICVPNDPRRLGQWGERYEGDFDFAYSTAQLGVDWSFRPEIIARYAH